MDENEKTFLDLLIEGTRLLRTGKAANAIIPLETAYAMHPENADAALNLGGAYILTGRFKKAVPILEELRTLEPKNAAVWTNLGAAYLGNPVLATDERQDQAVAAFKQALEIDPDAPNVAYNIGLIHRDRGENDEAIRWFERALQSDPHDRDAKRILNRLLNQDEQ